MIFFIKTYILFIKYNLSQNYLLILVNFYVSFKLKTKAKLKYNIDKFYLNLIELK